MSTKRTVTLEEVVGTLNALLEIDASFIHTLMENKAQPIPRGLQERDEFLQEDAMAASPFSLLNGLFGADSEGRYPIVRNYDEASVLQSVEINGEWEG